MMTKVQKRIVEEYALAYRMYCDEWLEAYDEFKNVSYAERKALTTDAGAAYLKAKAQYDMMMRTISSSDDLVSSSE